MKQKKHTTAFPDMPRPAFQFQQARRSGIAVPVMNMKMKMKEKKEKKKISTEKKNTTKKPPHYHMLLHPLPL